MWKFDVFLVFVNQLFYFLMHTCKAKVRILFQPEVRLVTTEHSRHFFDVNDVACRVYKDEDEWEVSVHFLSWSYILILYWPQHSAFGCTCWTPQH